MAKKKTTFFAMMSTDAKSKIHGYTIERNKANIPQGEKVTMRKYDKKLRKHVEFKGKEISKAK